MNNLVFGPSGAISFVDGQDNGSPSANNDDQLPQQAPFAIAHNAEQPAIASTPPVDAQASTSQPEIPPPLQPIDVPPQPDDPSVIVPPTPTKTLPLEETEGVTSGAVQPPGSTGDESIHNRSRRNSREMGEESDGSTSFTEDEDLEDGTPVDEVEDEEERLRASGRDSHDDDRFLIQNPAPFCLSPSATRSVYQQSLSILSSHSDTCIL